MIIAVNSWIRKGYRRLLHAVLSRLSGASFVAIFNLARRGRAHIKLSESGNYLLSMGSDRLVFVRSKRYRYYADGIPKRLDALYRAYLGPHEILEQGDVVIDCGANVGEFSLACHRRGATVFAFEPDPTEFAALIVNLTNTGCSPINKGLWAKSGCLSFALNNDTGDTAVSLDSVPIAGFAEFPVVSLDEFVASNGIRRIKLLKLEAEGYEPEVLDGAVKTLELVDYIAADLGPERGKEHANTFIPAWLRLKKYGFEPMHFDHSRMTCLFGKGSSLD